MTQPINNILESIRDIRKATLVLDNEEVENQVEEINGIVDNLEHKVKSLNFDIIN